MKKLILIAGGLLCIFANASYATESKLMEFVKDSDGHILTMNFAESTAYCAASGLRLPTNEELIRAAEFSEGSGIRETKFKDVDQYDPRVVQERQENDAEGFIPVLNK